MDMWPQPLKIGWDLEINWEEKIGQIMDFCETSVFTVSGMVIKFVNIYQIFLVV